MVNLDTHILVHLLAGTLTDRERSVLSAHSGGISSIVLWELAKLVELGRLELDLESPPFRSLHSSLLVWPISLPVAKTSTQLDFRADPADELIAATSVVHAVPLLTRDRRIRRSSVVPLA